MQVFSCEICKILTNKYFEEQLQMRASGASGECHFFDNFN